MTNETVFEYDGRVYVRPVSRGVTMFDPDGASHPLAAEGFQQHLYVEDAVPDGYYRMKISFERLSPEEERQAKEDYLGH